MATKVTIEGSRITPSDKLPAGVQSTVLLTDRVQRLIDRGFVVVISREELPDEEPTGAPTGDSDAGSDPDAWEGGENPDVAPEADGKSEPDPDPVPDPEPAEKPSRSRRGSKTVDDAPEE